MTWSSPDTGHIHAHEAAANRIQAPASAVLFIVLLLILIPVERVRLTDQLRVADVGLILATLYGLATIARSGRKIRLPLIAPMFLILGASLWATMTGLMHSVSVVAMIQEVYLFVCFIVLINLLSSFTPSQLDLVGRIWSLIACLQALIVLLGSLRLGPAWFYTSPESDLLLSTSSDLVRAVGTFVNPNAVGVYLSISFFVLLSTRWGRWMKAPSGALLLAGIFATGSMGAILSTLIGIAVLLPLLLSHLNRNGKFWLGFAIGCVAFALFIILWVTGMGRSPVASTPQDSPLMGLTFDRLERSVTRRQLLVNSMWLEYRENVMGTGPNTASLFRGSLHNDYIAFLFERGPLGLIGWIWVVVATLSTALRAAARSASRFQREQILILGAGFLACAVSAMTHEISHFRQVWLLMAYLYAAAYAVTTAVQSQTTVPTVEPETNPGEHPIGEPRPA